MMGNGHGHFPKSSIHILCLTFMCTSGHLKTQHMTINPPYTLAKSVLAKSAQHMR